MPSTTSWKARAKIDSLELTADEQKALKVWSKDADIDVDGVWKFVGRDADTGCVVDPASLPPADRPTVSALTSNRLTDVLRVRALAEARNNVHETPWRRARRHVRTYWPEGLIVALISIVGILVWRALGGFSTWPAPLGLAPQVVSARPIDKGVVLSGADLLVARLPPIAGSAADPSAIIGYRMRDESIGAGRVITPEMLEREQVIATAALPEGDRILANDVALEWRTPNKAALRQTSDAINRCTTTAIAKGAIVTPLLIGPCPP